MARRGDAPSRREVGERIDQQRDLMRETEATLEDYACDIETIRETLDGLEQSGTADGAEAVERHIDEADRVTVDAFDREDDGLEGVQADSEEFGGELQERSDATESDHQRISDAGGAMETNDAANALREALDAAHDDVEFLQENLNRAREAHAESERIQQELESRAHKGGGR